VDEAVHIIYLWGMQAASGKKALVALTVMRIAPHLEKIMQVLACRF
jgi:hypothetical protein